MWDDHAGLPPFRRCEADQYGLSDADVRRLLSRGVLIKLSYGLIAGYRRRELAVDHVAALVLRVQGMQRRYPESVAGGRTAAALHRLWLVGPVGPVRLLRARGYPRRKPDVVVDTVALPEEQLVTVEGVVATNIARTVIDLLACLPGGEALAIADSALRAGADRDALLGLAAELGRRAGSAEVRVVERADIRSESALESMSRWLFLVAILPAPELQVSFADDRGPFAVVDFLWREHGVVGEADGMLKYDADAAAATRDSDALRVEKLRQERLEQLGLIVVRWGWNDVVNHPARTVARVQAALMRGLSARGRTGRAGVP
jgi:hypothetical protein